jgi:hypothetical protein
MDTLSGRYLDYGGNPTNDPAVPYRLQGLLDSDRSTPVVFCRDEACADVVAALGLVATTVSNSVGAVWPDTLKARFRGRLIFLTPDLGAVIVKNLEAAAHETVAVTFAKSVADWAADDDCLRELVGDVQAWDRPARGEITAKACPPLTDAEETRKAELVAEAGLQLPTDATVQGHDPEASDATPTKSRSRAKRVATRPAAQAIVPPTTDSNTTPLDVRHDADEVQPIDRADIPTETEMATQAIKPIAGASEAPGSLMAMAPPGAAPSSTLMSEASPAAIAAGSPGAAAPGAPPTSKDPFADLMKLRVSQDFIGEAGVKRVLSTVPVRKPHAQEFFRVRSEEDYRGTFAMLQLKDERETYLVTPDMRPELLGHYHIFTLYACINRQGVEFLWPVRMQDPEGKDMDCWRSEREAAELAMEKWVNMKWNSGLKAYDFGPAPRTLSEPSPPEHSFQDLIRTGFRGRLIDRPDHEVIMRLRGLI